jgi:SAM-dependent methyltransferase
MSSSDAQRTRRERLEADARYNHALTDLDRAIVSASGRPLARDDFDRLSSALIVFLQQITAFVESGDRQIASEIGGRIDRIEQQMAGLDELSAQMRIVQRALQALRRAIDNPATVDRAYPPPDHSTAPPPAPAIADDKYLSFEDAFRGSDESVQRRVSEYVPIFRGRSHVVDLGCGRGELLAAFRAGGVDALGVDANSEMVAVARERGLSVVHQDALEYLTAAADESIGGAIAVQVIEHFEPPYLVRLLETAWRKMQPGAPILLETINPACWLAFFSSYLRDFTHVRPVHPETLQYLLRAAGFERVELRYSAPVPQPMKLKTVDLPAAVLSSSDTLAAAIAAVGHTVNANVMLLNNLMFTHMDYAGIGYRA